MTMSRINRKSELREAAFLILFRLDFQGSAGIMDQIDDFFDGEDGFSESEKQLIAGKVLGTTGHLEEIDKLIDEVSVGWKLSRMTKVDLTALRLACYEIKYDDAVSAATAINEAVELAKNYGTENSGSFVNGILAKVVK